MPVRDTALWRLQLPRRLRPAEGSPRPRRRAASPDVSGLGDRDDPDWNTASAQRPREPHAQDPRRCTRPADVTLKRGVIGALPLYNWLNDIRNGAQTAF